MLEDNKFLSLQKLVNSFTPEELIWANGYLNGLVSAGSREKFTPAIKTGVNKFTIAYGTETGNSKKLATEFAAKAKKHGINAKVQSLDQYRLNDLPKEEYFLAVISTHGDGEPPAAAKKFYDHVHQNGFKLEKLKYGVLALGDSAYPLFCKAGEDVDAQLDKLGGKRIVPLQKCDLDYDEEADAWIDEFFKSLSNQGQAQEANPPVLKKSTGKKTYTGNILSHVNLNDRGSNKETYHIEISAEETDYKPGDSIGIVPPNPVHIVEKILALNAIDHNTNVEYKGELIPVIELLTNKLNIIHLPERIIKHYAAIVKQDIPASKIDLLDLLKIYPVADEDQFLEVIKILEPTTPRLYSISSSPEAHSGEIHITVAKNTFMVNDELKNGLASDFLCHLSSEDNIRFYVNPNKQFRLPEEDKGVIMIGPGTGIAPFRAFIAERDALGASGKNWLFFGEQHFNSDFLYQTEIQNWVETGVLTKVNTAFSRDQSQKIYVQDKIWKHGAEFFEWLQAGSYVYICGSKYPMSGDVEATILKIVEHFGERTKEEAQEYLDAMKEEGRYVLDVY